jgi:hypothetical protein
MVDDEKMIHADQDLVPGSLSHVAALNTMQNARPKYARQPQTTKKEDDEIRRQMALHGTRIDQPG